LGRGNNTELPRRPRVTSAGARRAASESRARVSLIYARVSAATRLRMQIGLPYVVGPPNRTAPALGPPRPTVS